MNARFVSPARKELADAVAWYDDLQPDLGQRLLAEVDRVLLRIREYPHSAALILETARRVPIN